MSEMSNAYAGLSVRFTGTVLAAAVAILVFGLVVARPAGAVFGVAGFDGQVPASSTGVAMTQAGGHPYAISSEIEFNHHVDPNDVISAEIGGTAFLADGDVKDAVVDLPPGLIGNPGVLPKCTSEQLGGGGEGNSVGLGSAPSCPLDSQVGVATLYLNFLPAESGGTFPVFNMVTPSGVPARFGFQVLGIPILLNASLRSGSDYGVSVASSDIAQSLRIWRIGTTFWGVPADPSHDAQRCSSGSGFPEVCPDGGHPAGLAPAGFLTMPTACTAPGVGLETGLSVDSWQDPGVFAHSAFVSHEPPNYPAAPGERGAVVGVTGCDRVPFDPAVSIQPTTHEPDSPSGLNVTVSLPQEGLSNPAGIVQSALRKMVVALPQGLVVNPSAASGLGACSPGQIGLGSTAPAGCPESSKIGTVTVDTPLLEAPLAGSLYLASQGENPFGSLLAAYLVAEGSGVVLKIPGRIDADPVTGRLTVVFENLPQLPFAKVNVSLKSGPRAPLTTPSACGAAATDSSLEGWSAKTVTLSDPYTVDCTSGLGGFGPGFVAGSTSPQAGAFSAFTVSLSRQDGEQNLGGLTLKSPPGLLGIIKNVPQCPEPQASQGTCDEGSLIGHVTATVGAGPAPFDVQGGKAFLTGPYRGSPFGLSVTVPAKAGPLDLGTVVVRSRIDVDPHTAQITITSDPFPTILQGIPLQIRTVNVTVDRPSFMFNPTNCSPFSVEGAITSAQGAQAAVSSHFQAADCATLPFHPSFKVSTRARTSRANGAALQVKVTSASGQANLGKVAVSLPRQLASRLTTIRQACLAATFDQNPASCPEGSNIGVATATTPVLANPVTGPAYLVSHGGAAFPDLVMVLQGEGITLQVVGSIKIKGGVTSSAFNSIPDAPISTFELSLPRGPHSALAANLPQKAKGSLCGQNLTMPTTLTGQNGAVVKQATKITLTGCPKAKKKTKTRRHRAKAGKGSLRGRK